jgi:hypothetical protein
MQGVGKCERDMRVGAHGAPKVDFVQIELVSEREFLLPQK